MPLIVEGNKRGIKSNFFVAVCGKYNSPHLYKDLLINISADYNVSLWNIGSIKGRQNPVFFIEKNGFKEAQIDELNENQKICILTYSSNFKIPGQYEMYVDKADYIFMISEFFVDYYNLRKSDKNLFFGSPKFDTRLNEEEIIKRYNLEPGRKRALVVYPRHRDLHKINLKEIYSLLKKHNFDIIVKTRGKDPVHDLYHRGDYYFEDASWHPHTTIELMEVSDIVFNFFSPFLLPLDAKNILFTKI